MLGHLGLEIVDGDPASLLRVLPCSQAGGILVQRGRLQNKQDSVLALVNASNAFGRIRWPWP